MIIYPQIYVSGQNSDQLTSCAERNRNQNMRRCLNAVGEVALNETHFWFGYDYFTRCPRGSLDSLECYNPTPRIAFSLISKMFTPGTFNSSHIDRYLEVMYRSPPGKKIFHLSTTSWLFNETCHL